jgi:ATP-dependent Clp protease ATP-binding subunit ClpB
VELLDRGQLTDARGHVIDFCKTVIVMRSSVGAEYLINQPEEQDSEAVRDLVMGAVRAHFRAEFLDRVDEIILFRRLRREDIGRIIDVRIKNLNRLLVERKISRSTRRHVTGSPPTVTLSPTGCGRCRGCCSRCYKSHWPN